MMRIYYLISILFVAQLSSAQVGVISGKVTSAKTGETLPGAVIRADKETGTTCDADGKYRLELNAGKYTLIFNLISYEEKKISIELKAGETRELNVSLNESTKELNIVVISAGKFEQKIEDVTVSMEVLKPNLVEDKNTTQLDDAINQVPGVNVMDGQANIRGGSGWSYGAGSRVQILVDDLPQLTADANDTKWSFLPVENLEQIEVIKGASSVLFGSSALNGVINIRTAYPRDQPLTKVNVFTGFYDKATIELNDTSYDLNKSGPSPQIYSGINFFHSQKINRLDLVVGGNMFIDQGYRLGENEQRGRFNFNTRYRFKKLEGLSAGINFNTMTTDGVLFFLWKNDTSGGYVPANNTLSNYTTYRTNIDPFITWVGRKGESHKLRARWFNTTNQNNTSQNSTANLLYADYQFQKRFEKNLTLTAGIVEQQSKVQSQLYSDHDGNQLGVYLQGDLKWRQITFSGGGRVEQSRVDSLTDKWSPVFRTGINVHVLQETYLRASIGQGYRFPSIAERFVNTSVGQILIFPNNDLIAEKGLSTEIGVKQGLKIGSFSGYFDVAVFQNEYKNMIEFVFAQWGDIHGPALGNGFKSLNTGDTRIRGVDFSLIGKGKLIGQLEFTVFAGYTYIDPRQITYDSSYIAKTGVDNYMGTDSSNFLKYRYQHLLRADIEFKFQKLMLGIGLRYNSRMVNIDKIFTSSFFDYAFAPGLGIGHYMDAHRNGDTIFDLRAAYDMTKSIRVSFIVKNAFNYIYMERPADMQPPRTYVVQLGFTLPGR